MPQDWASRQALGICFWPSLQRVCFKISFHFRNFKPRDVPPLFEKLKGILPNSRIVAPASLPPMPVLDNDLGQGMWHGNLRHADNLFALFYAAEFDYATINPLVHLPEGGSRGVKSAEEEEGPKTLCTF